MPRVAPYAGWSLLPLTLGLGISTYVVFSYLFGTPVGVASGSALTLVSLLLLYGLGFFLKREKAGAAMVSKQEATSLKTKIEQLLTEARVIIPGGQALLGFQFVATLTRAFSELPSLAQAVHAAGLCAVALAVTLLMTPAAVHRIAYEGEDSEQFFRIAARLVVAATVPLAAGIAADVYVVFLITTQDSPMAALVAVASFAVLSGLWLIYPYLVRAREAAPAAPAKHGDLNRPAA